MDELNMVKVNLYRVFLIFVFFCFYGLKTRSAAEIVLSGSKYKLVHIAVVFPQNLHHHYQSYGGWTFEFDDYYMEGITKDLDNPNTQKLANIVDPFGELE